MDIQLKRGLLDVCVLACLMRGDSYGYQLIRELSTVVEISESTLYPILHRLEKGGFLTTYSREYEGRLRKYYSISRSGRDRIKSFLDDWHGLVSIYDFVSRSQR